MKNKICKISLFSAILASIVGLPVDARVTTKNSRRTYADAYNQVNAMRYQQEYMDENQIIATTASATGDLPVMVEDEKLASAILNNEDDAPNISQLDACSMIYPTGVFRWGIPESGIRRNQVPQCVAVVNLVDANTQQVLATTTLAAGDSMKCNVDSFPESGMSSDLKNGKVEIPADAAPTMADVEAVMNKEQKQNAGFKIAAGAILAGVAGNMLAPKEAGDTKLFGTGKTQLIDTAIGAASGAGIMAASSYSGKVAGDTIKSTAVNAASGMVVGNMLAGASDSNSVIATTKCTLKNQEYDCVIGNIRKEKPAGEWKEKYTESNNSIEYTYLVNRKGTLVKRCKTDTDSSLKDCETETKLIKIFVKLKSGNVKAVEKMESADWQEIDINSTYIPLSDSTTKYEKKDEPGKDDALFLIETATGTTGDSQHAYALFPSGSLNKPLGYAKKDWDDLAPKTLGYYLRNSSGTVQETKQESTAEEKIYFQPSSRDASDGGLIDLSNEARAKGTLVGTATGGAMGGFAGYEGAKQEISERWVSAVQAYNDSLSNFACTTGTRFISKYNDYAEIPELKVNKE